MVLLLLAEAGPEKLSLSFQARHQRAFFPLTLCSMEANAFVRRFDFDPTQRIVSLYGQRPAGAERWLAL
ncbi:hypothetical protein SU32_12635 [Ahrensia marina]|uniref:Uncharacterized protein n=1 Tax=Ahrensia marina TaxID=1514904 RepID=A0A0M9GLJ4_9HYPH|nr:hypothetical protein SU32_12635 [Ahrensia marina]